VKSVEVVTKSRDGRGTHAKVADFQPDLESGIGPPKRTGQGVSIPSGEERCYAAHFSDGFAFKDLLALRICHSEKIWSERKIAHAERKRLDEDKDRQKREMGMP